MNKKFIISEIELEKPKFMKYKRALAIMATGLFLIES